MTENRVILHCDMNSFFCSVELLDHPELKDKPVAVAGRADARHGIILAKNQLAKQFGVTTPEPVYQAMRKCPDLVLLDPHHEKYTAYCRQINEIYLRYTNLVELFSIDESWLDVTASLRHLQKTGKKIGDEIRETVYRETGLTQSVGVSFNKTFAKMGSDYKKPFATTEITRENFKSLLWPLPAGELFFVGRSTAERLKTLNIKTIGDIARADEQMLISVFGKHGSYMHCTANGEDDSPVLPYDSKSEVKSVGHGITFKRNIRGREDIQTAVKAISDNVAARLRRTRLRCRGVKVDIKSPEFITISRQLQLDCATNLASVIADAAMRLIEANRFMQNEIRLITITGINTIAEDEEDSLQLSLFDDPSRDEKQQKEMSLAGTIDEIRSRFGRYAIVRGSIIDNDMGITYEEK